jgi:hypothetical protein
MKKFSSGARPASSSRSAPGPRAAPGPRSSSRDEGRTWAPPRGSRGGARFDSTERPRRARDGDAADPYQPVRRPPRFRAEGDASARDDARGFTVNLDPDVARVFRGDASVNKALRLVLQLMQVVQGPPPRRDGERPYVRPVREGAERRAPRARFGAEDE